MDAGIAVSETYASAFGKKFNREFSVIRNVPETIEITPEINNPAPEKFLLYQGVLNEGRGIAEAINAIRHSPYQFTVAGSGDIEVELKEQVRENGQQDQVRFTGKVAPAALRVLTRQAWVGLNLLENKGLSYYYSLANKFFDYVHAGIPQISMDFPEYRHLNEIYEVAILIPDLSERSIRGALHKLEDADLYERLHHNTVAAARLWHWDEEKKQLLKIISQLTHS